MPKLDKRKAVWAAPLKPPKPRDWMIANRNLIQFRVSDSLALEIRGRAPGDEYAGMARTVRHDLTRYYELLQVGMARFDFTEAEATCLVNAVPIDTIAEPVAFLATIKSRCRAGLAVEWGVDTDTLMAKLAAATPLEVWTIIDAVQRWLRLSWTDTHQGLVSVGLLREPAP